MYAVPAVLGTIAVKNERFNNAVKHTSYWEASKSFIIDFIPDGIKGSIRLSGKVNIGPDGPADLKDVELHDGFEYDESDVDTLERAFLEPVKKEE